ncbi:NAD(P)-binding protein [Armillaria gallica]|uniref:NAD(P)-binding protein n=1 Tax=Armillaria gallica TaxID=47427 RepID=A0A2H3DDU7_ARMGA|nr:NAD(P)-binding protein [Armillaria gallica]
MAIVMSFSGPVDRVMGGGMGILQMNVTDEKDVKVGAKYIEDIEGKLNILVNKFVYGAHGSLLPYTNLFIAGSHGPDFTSEKYSAENPFEPQTVQNRADLFMLNTIVLFFIICAIQSLLVKGASSHLQGMSSIINISSIAAKLNTSLPMVSVAYGVTEAALDKLALVLAMSFGGRGISIWVNMLQPGLFSLEMVPPEFLEALKTELLPGQVTLIPVRRHGNAETGMMAFYLVVSDYTNGAVLSADGGLLLVNPWPVSVSDAVLPWNQPVSLSTSSSACRTSERLSSH